MAGLVAELPGWPGLAVVGGSHGLVEIGGVAFDDGGVANRVSSMIVTRATSPSSTST
ncbi:hypothetical protein [Aquamicrobium terrae]|uniref:Uncharacterized protein n=1 Tax=Aquamicrobium terrae TaxID=1324945 RepID=A0ABV2N699_9HYPH